MAIGDITYAQVFNQGIDSKFAVALRTGVLENTNGIIYEGGKQVRIPKLTLQGLGSTNNCEIPEGQYEFDYETKSLQWDRSRSFSIPRYAVSETNFALTAGTILGEFITTQVVPEIDKLRLSTIASTAITAGNVTAEGATPTATPVGMLLDDIANVQKVIGEDKELFIFLTNSYKSRIMKSSEIEKVIQVRDYESRGANFKIEALNDSLLIGCPDAYLKSAFDLYDGKTSGQEAGGVVPNSDALSLNYIIVARDSALALGYPNVEKVITPDENQAKDCWSIKFRVYHGLFVLDQKISGIWVNRVGAAN